MRLLLDTHCWLWLKDDPARLPSPLRRRIMRDPTTLVFSAVSAMEIGIKHALGRLRLAANPVQVIDEFREDGVSMLSATVEHALQSAALPLLHRDPFDRLLVAQAQIEGLTLVTADANILAYAVKTIDARK